MSSGPYLVPGVLAGCIFLSHAFALWQTRRNPPLGQKVEVDGVDMHFLDRPAVAAQEADGDALPVVFIHGASGNLRDPWLAFGKTLERHRLIFVDRPGQGHSERGDRRSADPMRQAELVEGVLAHLGIKRAIIVGHSLGASITAAFALRFPKVTAGLVFVSPASHPWGGELPLQHRLMRLPVIGTLFAHALAVPLGLALMPGMLKSTFAPEPVPEGYMRSIAGYMILRPGSFRSNSNDVSHLHGHLTAMAPRYREISAPTVVITGDSDPVVYAHIHAAGLARDIAGSRLIVLEGVGHMPHHTASDVVVSAIDEVAGKAMRV
jgi:pimeloyl-ACP methyl ester carboxylesterase